MTERDLELQDELNAQLPIIPQSDFGVERCECIVVTVIDEKATNICNECFAARLRRGRAPGCVGDAKREGYVLALRV